MSDTSDVLSAEDFAERLPDLPEEGRWSELAGGEITSFEAPDDPHRTIVFNVTEALGSWLSSKRRKYGAIVTNLAVVTRRDPDSVRRPPIAFFIESEPFAYSDEVMTTDTPDLVVEVASTNDRRLAMDARIKEYQVLEIPRIWRFDPHSRQMRVYLPNGEEGLLDVSHDIWGGEILPGFRMEVLEAFRPAPE